MYVDFSTTLDVFGSVDVEDEDGAAILMKSQDVKNGWIWVITRDRTRDNARLKCSHRCDLEMTSK